MAEAFLKSTRLRLVFDYGVDENDRPVFKSKTFNNVRRDSTADGLYDAAQAIASLSANPIWAIERNDSYDIDA